MTIPSLLVTLYTRNIKHVQIIFFSDGIIPHDGVPIEDVVTVSLGLTVMYMILATGGIVFAVVCLTFTIIFRNTK